MNPYRAHSIRFLAYGAGIFAAALALWVDRMFGSPSIDQLLYHVHYAEGAAVEMSEVFVVTFLVEVLGLSLAGAAIATALHAWLARGRSGWLAGAMRALPHLAFAGGLAVLLIQFSVFSYAAAHFDEDRFGKSYRDPASATLKEMGRRNLVLIYVESLEETYADATLFGSDLLAPLRTVGGQSLPRYLQAPGATWTIAAMVATQCGVPLTVYSEDEVRRDGDQRAFLAGATCLGDILQARGYRNVFLGGAPLSFAGKGTFLRDHGYEERYGKDEWLAGGARPPGSAAPEMGGWGMFDDALLGRAREQLAALHASGQPFNLTVLTLDSHNPHGYPSPSCRGDVPRDQYVPFERIVACSSRHLAEFVRFVRDKGYLENTTLVILGDHLAVGNPVDSKLRSVQDRRVFNLFVGAEPLPKKAEPVLSFDMFPTLLEATGMRAEDGRLGLGRSAWAAEAARPEWVQHPNLPALAASPSYQRLWKGSAATGG
jgi:phosphoglycerol transferase